MKEILKDKLFGNNATLKHFSLGTHLRSFRRSFRFRERDKRLEKHDFWVLDVAACIGQAAKK